LKKIRRKEFIRLSVLAGAGVCITGCFNNEQKKVAGFPADTSHPKVNKPEQPLTVQLYKKGDTQYEILRKGFNKRINKYPAVIATCNNTDDVVQAVQYANRNKLQICVKSGGHSFEGYSSNNDGMVINLSALNTITWEGSNIIHAGPGCTLGQVYAEVLPKKKILPGGSCAGVGLGGLTLGGGYGLFGRKYGLTCDSLTEVTMVDGEGVIRNSKDDSDLLWACRGGGNGNFGIITEMRFYLHDAPAWLQSTRFTQKVTDSDKAKQVLQKWFELSKMLPPSCFSAFVLNKTKLYILLTNCGEETEEVKQFTAGLSALTEHTKKGKQSSLVNAVKVFYGVQHPIFFKNASAGLYESFNEIEPFINDVLQKVITTSGMIYQVNTLGGRIADKDLESESAFPHRQKGYLSELQTYWETEGATNAMVRKFEEVQEIFRSNGIKAQYRNYPDIECKDWETAYYGNNYSRLQNIKKKYDPNNNIRHEQSIRI
jgi:hypothetical protein